MTRALLLVGLGMGIGAAVVAISDDHMYAARKWAFVGEKPPISGLCSEDFYHWWPARNGGECWSSDKP